MVKGAGEQPGSLEQRIGRFHSLLDALEAQLDSGFFLSLIGKIVVDEKRIYSILSELRSLRFDLNLEKEHEQVKAGEISAKSSEPKVVSKPQPTAENRVGQAADDAGQSWREAEYLRRGADEYAAETLDNLEQTLQKMLDTLREGKKFLRRRLEREVKEDGSTEV